jgi:hypothetical protein
MVENKITLITFNKFYLFDLLIISNNSKLLVNMAHRGRRAEGVPAKFRRGVEGEVVSEH